MYILCKGIFIRHTLLTGDDWLLLQLRHTTGYCRDNAYCTSLTQYLLLLDACGIVLISSRRSYKCFLFLEIPTIFT